MKILVIAPTPFFADRGTHIRILEEALALEKMGNKVTIATYHIGRNIHAEVETKMDIRRIRRLLFWYKKLEAGPDWQKILLDLMLLRKVFNLARTQKPEVIHAHLHEGVMIGWLVQKLLFWRRIKLIADFHGSLTKEMVSHGYLGAGLLKKIFVSIERMIDNMGDAVVTSSSENTEDVSILRNKKGEVLTALDGVNMSYYEDAKFSKAELRKEFELPDEKTIVAYTGAMMPNKGIKYLLDAIDVIGKKREDIFFVLAGFPPEHVQRFVNKHGLQKIVRVVSPLNYFELPKLLMASDIGVDPKDSSTKQASGKILQYMGAGLAIVCFDRPNNREYLGEAGVYASAISGEALADEICAIVDDAQLREKKGAEARKRAVDFSWDKSAELIKGLYQKNSA